MTITIVMETAIIARHQDTNSHCHCEVYIWDWIPASLQHKVQDTMLSCHPFDRVPLAQALLCQKMNWGWAVVPLVLQYSSPGQNYCAVKYHSFKGRRKPPFHPTITIAQPNKRGIDHPLWRDIPGDALFHKTPIGPIFRWSAFEASGWRSAGKVLAWCLWGTEFNPLYHIKPGTVIPSLRR